MSSRRRKLDEQQAAEFERMFAIYNAAIEKLPANWREVAEGKAKLPETLDEMRAQLGDAFSGVAGTVQ